MFLGRFFRRFLLRREFFCVLCRLFSFIAGVFYSSLKVS